jgi:hypothetical protein
MPNTHFVGQGVRLRGQFTVTGSFADPNIVELYIRKPNGTVETHTLAGGGVSQETTGKFFRDIFVDSSGQWWYEFFGSGIVNADNENYFEVPISVLP